MNDSQDFVEFTPDRARHASVVSRRKFATIASAPAPPRRRRRWRRWLPATAAVLLLTASGCSSSSDSGSAPESGAGGAIAEEAPDTAADGGAVETDGSDALRPGADSDVLTDRQIIHTGSAVVVAEDVPQTAQVIADTTTDLGGYVESLTIGAGSEPWYDADGNAHFPQSEDDARVVVRVPAEKLTEAMASLATLGEITSSSIGREDVTETYVDYQARIASLQESVGRLQELMAAAGNVSDLLAAERELSSRQAELESYQQQLTSLSNRVALSTLTVIVTQHFEPEQADPAGFGDGLAAGVSGLVTALNGLVVVLGFLLPWLGVAVVACGVIWIVFRIVRRARTNRPEPADPDIADDSNEGSGTDPA